MDHPPVELFQQTSEIATLRAAWTKVLANAGTAGGDGVTVERFALVADA
jgi:hypothetical protein